MVDPPRSPPLMVLGKRTLRETSIVRASLFRGRLPTALTCTVCYTTYFCLQLTRWWWVDAVVCGMVNFSDRARPAGGLRSPSTIDVYSQSCIRPRASALAPGSFGARATRSRAAVGLVSGRGTQVQLVQRDARRGRRVSTCRGDGEGAEVGASSKARSNRASVGAAGGVGSGWAGVERQADRGRYGIAGGARLAETYPRLPRTYPNATRTQHGSRVAGPT